MARINIGQLSPEVMRELEVYRNNTAETVKKAVTETARETAKELRQTAPVGPTGEYAKSWTYRSDPQLKGKWRCSMVVYSKKPDHRITHLLEHGHAKAGGGRVEGRAHIRPAEQKAVKRLESRLRSGLKGGGGGL